MKNARRFHWFAYHAPKSETKASYRKSIDQTFDASRIIHQTRDGTAFVELSQLLASLGCQYIGPILNLPAEAYETPGGPRLMAPESLDVFSPGDIIVQCTRPPLNEDRLVQILKSGTPEERSRKRGQTISRSETPIERAIIASVKQHFLTRCSRVEVQLGKELSGLLRIMRSDLHRYARVEFQPSVNAGYSKVWCDRERMDYSFRQRTAGYLVYIPQLPKPFDNVSALLAWAQAGVDTLFWAWALRKRFAKLISSILRERNCLHFVMAEWDLPIVHKRPTSLRAFEHVTPTILFHARRNKIEISHWKIL